MRKLAELARSAHVHVAVANGLSILAIAYVSKHVLRVEVNPFLLVIPAFVVLFYEALAGHARYKHLAANSVYWVVAVALATAGILLWQSQLAKRSAPEPARSEATVASPAAARE